MAISTGLPCRTVRRLASERALSEEYAYGGDLEQRTIRAALLELCFPLVFERITRRHEFAKGHSRCADNARRLEPACHDHYVDDVLAVVDYTVRHCNRPVANLDGWIVSRAEMAVVDGYRRRRGERGALQRPRIPGWLESALDGDPWLMQLSLRILEWVGTPTTAGYDVWPLDAWTCERQGHPLGRFRTTSVHADVESVLRTMRAERPKWFRDFVERPLARKIVPVSPVDPGEAAALDLGAEGEDRHLVEAAAALIDALPDPALVAVASGEELLQSVEVLADARAVTLLQGLRPRAVATRP